MQVIDFNLYRIQDKLIHRLEVSLDFSRAVFYKISFTMMIEESGNSRPFRVGSNPPKFNRQISISSRL